MTRPVHIALGALATALVLLACGEVWYLGNAPTAATDERPVVLGDLATRAAVDAAAQDLTEIVSTSYRNYDEQVVQATPERVQALLFLDQQVSEDGRAPVRVPYRTLVTMTHTAHGWLVSDIQTR